MHSDNWHVVSRSTSSIKAPALLQTSQSGNENQAVASAEQTLNLSSERQFQSEQHTDAVFSSNQTRAVSSEQYHTSSQQTYTTSAGETRVVLPEQAVPVSAELIHSISSQYTVGGVREG